MDGDFVAVNGTLIGVVGVIKGSFQKHYNVFWGHNEYKIVLSIKTVGG